MAAPRRSPGAGPQDRPAAARARRVCDSSAVEPDLVVLVLVGEDEVGQVERDVDAGERARDRAR